MWNSFAFDRPIIIIFTFNYQVWIQQKYIKKLFPNNIEIQYELDILYDASTAQFPIHN